MDIQVKLALGNARGQTGRVAIATEKMWGLSFGVIAVIGHRGRKGSERKEAKARGSPRLTSPGSRI